MPPKIWKFVWRKGQEIPGWDSAHWRYDHLGNPIKYDDYGDRNSAYGWEVDHRIPVAHGGSDALGNLRPLQWEANVQRGRSFLGQ